MEKPKYYDVVTKQEISEQDLRKDIPYIVLTDKWKIRMVTFRQDGKVEEKLLTLKEEEIAKREILKQRLIQNGYQVQDIKQKDNFIIDEIKINVPTYAVQLEDSQGRKGEVLYDCEKLEGLIKNTEQGKVVELSEKTISGEKLIEMVGKPASISKMTSDRKVANIILKIDQWGVFKETYNLRNPEDRKRLMEDEKRMPKNREEAMQMRQGKAQNRNFEE